MVDNIEKIKSFCLFFSFFPIYEVLEIRYEVKKYVMRLFF